jgi:hypothetical protein
MYILLNDSLEILVEMTAKTEIKKPNLAPLKFDCD